MWNAGTVRRWLLALSAVAAFAAAAWLSLMPFNDREVRCGPPLLGANPPANYSITPGTCSDMASDRLVLAAGLLVVSVALALAVVINTRTSKPPRTSQERQPAHR
jgi:hypothetical protein